MARKHDLRATRGLKPPGAVLHGQEEERLVSRSETRMSQIIEELQFDVRSK